MSKPVANHPTHPVVQELLATALVLAVICSLAWWALGQPSYDSIVAELQRVQQLYQSWLR